MGASASIPPFDGGRQTRTVLDLLAALLKRERPRAGDRLTLSPVDEEILGGPS